MADCEFLGNCIFFNDKMAAMPSTAGVIKMMYCNDNFVECARYVVRQQLGKEHVPSDLFPNHHDRAQLLVGSK
ncbi:hypothetical protein GMSM_14790 [Geomonas sp. Red276]